MIIKIQNLEEYKSWCETLAKQIEKSITEASKSHIILLSGSMGTGKTQFVKFFMSCISNEEASSPTFSLLNQYQTQMGLVEHIDIYRIESDEDLESTGFWESIQSDSKIVFVEWSDRLPDSVWPVDKVRHQINISIDQNDPNQRIIEYNNVFPSSLSF